MIITQRNGRRASVFTEQDADIQFDEMMRGLSEDERRLLMAMEIEKHAESAKMEREMHTHLYAVEPVSMEQFIEDPYYLGESCDTLFPQLKKDLIELFGRPHREALFTGSIGVGKTFIASISICRILYELSCLISPQKAFGMSAGTELVIPLISKNLTLARDVMKTAVDDKIRLSPYFMSKFAPNMKKEFSLFPNSIKVVVGSYGSERILGTYTVATFMDECLTKKSVVTIERHDGVLHEAVENLIADCQLLGADCKLVCLDHVTGEVKSGWWRIKESTVQPLSNIRTRSASATFSHEHPVLVKRGNWLVYVHASDVVAGDFVVTEDWYGEKWSKNERRDETEIERGSEENDREKESVLWEEAFGRVAGEDAGETCEAEDSAFDGSEIDFACGVRRERLRVCDLPDGLSLEEVCSVYSLPAEQTYSICTEYDTFIADGLVVHNTNFPPKRNAQQITTGFGQKANVANYDIVEKVYRTILRRIKSRFERVSADLPGMVILASSAATVESFTERKMRESKEDPKVFIRDHTPWTAKPKDRFSDEVFYVMCSTSSMKARILKAEEYEMVNKEYLDENDMWIIDVPIDYKEDFEANMEDSLRDIAGVSTQAISAYIQRPNKVVDRIDDREHPFSQESWVAGGPGKFEWSKLVREFERKLPGGYTEPAYSPIINPSKYRWCHIDVSLSGDSTGFCVGHVERWVEVVRRGDSGERYTDVAPYYVIDMMLQVHPPPAEQIYMPDLRQMIYQMQDKGFKFIGFSSDSYQYAEMHQQLKRKGVSPHLISMDKTTQPYDELKSAIYEDRIDFYKYQPFLDELKFLEYDRVVGKIDHPVGGCFVGDTRIPLLDGTCPTIRDLVGKEVQVYSCTADGRIVPGIGSCRRTKETCNLVDIVLDSGAVERCTPEHLWMLRDGSYKMAKDLIPAVDRLMPINRIWPVNGGYERVVDSHGKRSLTHHMVVAGDGSVVG
ncbi:MAG: Hint domain-containing protein, partial [Methanosarcinaceae archaeon]